MVLMRELTPIQQHVLKKDWWMSNLKRIQQRIWWLSFPCKRMLSRAVVRTNRAPTGVPSPQQTLHSPPQGFIVFSQGQPGSLFSRDWFFFFFFSDPVSWRKNPVSESDKYYKGTESRKEEVEGDRLKEKASRADKGRGGQSLRDVAGGRVGCQD